MNNYDKETNNSFNKEPYDNSGVNPENEIDFERMNRAAQNVRFYNRLIWGAIAGVILAGVICGGYLYYFISSKLEKQNPAIEIIATETKNKTQERGEEKLNGTSQQSQNGPETIINPPVNRIGRESEKKLPDANITTAVRSTKETELIAKKNEKSTEINLISQQSSIETAVLKPRNISTNTSEISTAQNAVSIIKSSEISINIQSGTMPVETAAQKYEIEIDCRQLEKFLKTGEENSFDSKITKYESMKNISQNSLDRINLLCAKKALFINRDRHSAQKKIALIKNVEAAGAAEYCISYLNLFSQRDKSNCVQLIDHVLSSPKQSLNDSEKMEIAKIAFKTGIYDQTQKALNYIIATSSFEFEINFLKKMITRFKGTLNYQGAAKLIGEHEYNIDPNGLVAESHLLKSKKSVLFKSNIIMRSLLMPRGPSNSLYAFDEKNTAYEIKNNGPNITVKKYPLISQPEFNLIGCFDVYKHQQVAVIENSGNYQLTPINNNELKQKYLPAFFDKKAYTYPFIISPSGRHAVRIIISDEESPTCEIELMNLENSKIIFRARDVFYRTHDLGFMCFSEELSKVSINTFFNDNVFYYFSVEKSVNSTAGLPFALKVRLNSYDTEFNEHAALMSLTIDNAASLNISYISSFEKLFISYEGPKLQAGNMVLDSGSWLIGKKIDGAVKISKDIISHVTGIYNNAEKALTIYGIGSGGNEIVKYELLSSSFDEIMNHISIVFDYYPHRAIELINKVFSKRNMKFINLASLKIKGELQKKANDYEEIKSVETYLQCLTLMRLNLHFYALKRAEDYIKNAVNMTTAANAKILEIKTEAEKELKK